MEKVQGRVNERDQKIWERITNIITSPLGPSTEREKTSINAMIEYSFDKETKVERDLVDGWIADLIEKLEESRGAGY
jgi:hypothetical protein